MESPVTEIVGDAGKSDPRTWRIQGYGWHHTAGGSYAGNKRVMNTLDRGVSCNTLISGPNIGLVSPFNKRAYTTGSPYDGGRGARLDHMSLTSEVVNDFTPPDAEGWNFTDETYASCAKMAAFAFTEFGVPLKLAPAYGTPGHWSHGQANRDWQAGYGTECPGRLSVPRIIAEGIEILVTPILAGDEEMKFIQVIRNTKTGQTYILNKVTGRSIYIDGSDTYQMHIRIGTIDKEILDLGENDFWRYLDTYERLGGVKK